MIENESAVSHNCVERSWWQSATSVVGGCLTSVHIEVRSPSVYRWEPGMQGQKETIEPLLKISQGGSNRHIAALGAIPISTLFDTPWKPSFRYYRACLRAQPAVISALWSTLHVARVSRSSSSPSLSRYLWTHSLLSCQRSSPPAKIIWHFSKSYFAAISQCSSSTKSLTPNQRSQHPGTKIICIQTRQ